MSKHQIVAIVAFCLIGLVIGIVVSRLFRPANSTSPSENSVIAREIPEVISQLQQSAQDGNFAVIMFVPPDSKDGEAINLQYSLEDGIVGFDWVLIGPRNIADKAKIQALASKLGYQLEQHEMNGCKYLRTTGKGIAELGMRIIEDIYKMDPKTKLDINTEGFTWQPSAP